MTSVIGQANCPKSVRGSIIIWLAVIGVHCTLAFGFESKLARPFDQLTTSGDRKQWIESIAGIGDGRSLNVSEELPILIEALRDSDNFVARRAAAFMLALAVSHPNDRDMLLQAVPAMESHLRSPDAEGVDDWKMTVVHFISIVDPHPSTVAVQAMQELMRRPNGWGANRVGIQALARLKPIPKDVLIALIQKMNDPIDEIAKTSVIESLGRNQITDSESVRAIELALGDSDVYVQRAAADALREIGPAAKIAVPALKRLAATSGADERAVQNARAALKALESQ